MSGDGMETDADAGSRDTAASDALSMEQARAALERQLDRRLSKEMLLERNILHGGEDTRARAEALRRGLLNRPTINDLQHSGIMKNTSVAPSIAERHQLLAWQQRQGVLSGHLEERPGPLDLVHDGILKPRVPILDLLQEQPAQFLDDYEDDDDDDDYDDVRHDDDSMHGSYNPDRRDPAALGAGQGAARSSPHSASRSTHSRPPQRPPTPPPLPSSLIPQAPLQTASATRRRESYARTYVMPTGELVEVKARAPAPRTTEPPLLRKPLPLVKRDTGAGESGSSQTRGHNQPHDQIQIHNQSHSHTQGDNGGYARNSSREREDATRQSAASTGSPHHGLADGSRDLVPGPPSAVSAASAASAHSANSWGGSNGGVGFTPSPFAGSHGHDELLSPYSDPSEGGTPQPAHQHIVEEQLRHQAEENLRATAADPSAPIDARDVEPEMQILKAQARVRMRLNAQLTAASHAPGDTVCAVSDRLHYLQRHSREQSLDEDMPLHSHGHAQPQDGALRHDQQAQHYELQQQQQQQQRQQRHEQAQQQHEREQHEREQHHRQQQQQHQLHYEQQRQHEYEQQAMRDQRHSEQQHYHHQHQQQHQQQQQQQQQQQEYYEHHNRHSSFPDDRHPSSYAATAGNTKTTPQNAAVSASGVFSSAAAAAAAATNAPSRGNSASGRAKAAAAPGGKARKNPKITKKFRFHEYVPAAGNSSGRKSQTGSKRGRHAHSRSPSTTATDKAVRRKSSISHVMQQQQQYLQLQTLYHTTYGQESPDAHLYPQPTTLYVLQPAPNTVAGLRSGSPVTAYLAHATPVSAPLAASAAPMLSSRTRSSELIETSSMSAAAPARHVRPRAHVRSHSQPQPHVYMEAATSPLATVEPQGVTSAAETAPALSRPDAATYRLLHPGAPSPQPWSPPYDNGGAGGAGVSSSANDAAVAAAGKVTRARRHSHSAGGSPARRFSTGTSPGRRSGIAAATSTATTAATTTAAATATGRGASPGTSGATASTTFRPAASDDRLQLYLHDEASDVVGALKSPPPAPPMPAHMAPQPRYDEAASASMARPGYDAQREQLRSHPLLQAQLRAEAGEAAQAMYRASQAQVEEQAQARASEAEQARQARAYSYAAYSRGDSQTHAHHVAAAAAAAEAAQMRSHHDSMGAADRHETGLVFGGSGSGSGSGSHNSSRQQEQPESTDEDGMTRHHNDTHNHIQNHSQNHAHGYSHRHNHNHSGEEDVDLGDVDVDVDVEDAAQLLDSVSAEGWAIAQNGRSRPAAFEAFQNMAASPGSVMATAEDWPREEEDSGYPTAHEARQARARSYSYHHLSDALVTSFDDGDDSAMPSSQRGTQMQNFRGDTSPRHASHHRANSWSGNWEARATRSFSQFAADPGLTADTSLDSRDFSETYAALQTPKLDARHPLAAALDIRDDDIGSGVQDNVLAQLSTIDNNMSFSAMDDDHDPSLLEGDDLGLFAFSG